MWSKLCVLSLAALASAGPMDLYANMRFDRRADVTEAMVSNFDFYAKHSAAAYCNSDRSAGDTISCGGSCDAVQKNNVKILGTYDGLFTGIASYVARDDVRKEIVFAVRGSSNIRNWIANFDFDLEDSDLSSGSEVHHGFNHAWEEMSSGVLAAVKAAKAANAGYKIIATGHSLGGAVATIGAAYLRKAGLTVELYTYGAPRLGNGVVSDFITGQGTAYRVTHLNDPVPRLPPKIFGYRHISPEYWLSQSEATTDTYPVDQIKVCTGNANTECNGSTNIIDIEFIDRHLTYFGNIAGCSSIGLKTREDNGTAIDDAALVAKLNAWAEQDRAL